MILNPHEKTSNHTLKVAPHESPSKTSITLECLHSDGLIYWMIASTNMGRNRGILVNSV